MERNKVGEVSVIVYNFGLLLETNLKIDKARFNEQDSSYGVYRALKETMRSRELENMQLAKVDIYSIAYFLLDNEKTAYAFADWINTRAFDWENHWLPRNANRLYAVGKKEILRRKGVRR